MIKKYKKHIPLIVVCFIAESILALYIIHVLWVMQENPKMSLLGAIAQGLDDMTIQPFAIFPIPKNAFLWVVLISAIIAGLIYTIYLDKAAKRHYDPNTVQGDAKWLTDLDDYNRRFTDPIGEANHDGPNNMILAQDLYMSMDAQRIRRNLSVMVVGGSGSGKSRFFVAPNLMQVGAGCSFVITDPSGGLLQQYAGFLTYMGYQIKVFNLDHMSVSNRYNPFNYIHSDKDVEVLVNTLISNTTPPDKKGGDDFWVKSETALLVAIVSYLYHYGDKRVQNFSTVMDLLRQGSVDENESEKEKKGSALDYMFEEVREVHGIDAFPYKQYRNFKMGAGKTKSSILISCAVRLQAFDLLDVAALTNTDDIALDNIGDEKTALFIITPTGDTTFNFLASMMYSQLFQRIYSYAENTAQYSQLIVDNDNHVWKTFRAVSPTDKNRAEAEAKAYFERIKDAKIKYSDTYKWYEIRTKRGELVGYRGSEEEAQKALYKLSLGKVISNSEQSNNGQRLPIHVRMILDEFANLGGKIPGFSERVATQRKYELSTTIIVQNIQQMKNLYRDEWGTIVGNCDNTVYLGGGADTDSPEFFASLLGKETRVVLGTSFNANNGGSSLSRQGVELMSAAQLRTLPEDECVVIPKSLSAFRGKKFDPEKHPNMPLVHAIVKKQGAYIFDPKKAAELERENKDEEEKLLEAHGKPIEKVTIQEQAKRNEALSQKKDEYERNMDANNNPLIQPGKIIGPDDQIMTTPKTGEPAQELSIEKTMDTLEDLWGEVPGIYGTQQAAAS